MQMKVPASCLVPDVEADFKPRGTKLSTGLQHTRKHRQSTQARSEDRAEDGSSFSVIESPRGRSTSSPSGMVSP